MKCDAELWLALTPWGGAGAGIQRRLPGGVKRSELSRGNCGRQPAERKRGVSEGKHTEAEWLGVLRKLQSVQDPGRKPQAPPGGV